MAFRLSCVGFSNFVKTKKQNGNTVSILFSFRIVDRLCYIMPPMPPAGIAGTAGSADFFSANTHSVVRNIEAIDAAFSSATRDTFVGS